MVENSLKNISEVIISPEKVSEKDLRNIFDLTLKYSFSGICFLFLARVLNSQKRIGFEKVLNSTALRIADRSLLYDCIHDEKKLKNNFKVEENISIDKNIDLNELEKNIYGSLIQNQIINELEDQVDNEKEENEEKNGELSENLKMPFEKWLSGTETFKYEEKERHIDTIIRNLNERKISNEKKNFYSSSVAAKKSIKENNEMNTETLAEIYLKQGNYPRAIEIYEHLMLSNPEKKLFFASRINYIKLKTQL
jgi:tetratricopeptide (TPR) repeat protein